MEKEEFSEIRRQLGKTQAQMSQLLGISLTSIKSFEQGWRKIPAQVERQTLFLLVAMKSQGESLDCWEIMKCSVKMRQKCPAWEFQIGNLCWFINGTICRGEVKESWKEKIKVCRECDVLKRKLLKLDK